MYSKATPARRRVRHSRALIVTFPGALADADTAFRAALACVLTDRAQTAPQTDSACGFPHQTISHDTAVASLHAFIAAGLMRQAHPRASVLRLVRRAQAAGVPCAVVSSAPSELVRPSLTALGLASIFTAVVVNQAADRGEPAAQMYRCAARLLEVVPRHCLAIDIDPESAAAARHTGMRVWNPTAHEDRAPFHADGPTIRGTVYPGPSPAGGCGIPPSDEQHQPVRTRSALDDRELRSQITTRGSEERASGEGGQR